MNKPGWLVPGAEVIIYADYPIRLIATTTVREVGQRFFTTVADLPGHGQPGKFTIRTLTNSSTHRYSVLPVDDITAQDIVRRSSCRAAVEEAGIAIMQWERNKDKASRDAAIVALQAINYEDRLEISLRCRTEDNE